MYGILNEAGDDVVTFPEPTPTKRLIDSVLGKNNPIDEWIAKLEKPSAKISDYNVLKVHDQVETNGTYLIFMRKHAYVQSFHRMHFFQQADIVLLCSPDGAVTTVKTRHPNDPDFALSLLTQYQLNSK